MTIITREFGLNRKLQLEWSTNPATINFHCTIAHAKNAENMERMNRISHTKKFFKSRKSKNENIQHGLVVVNLTNLFYQEHAEFELLQPYSLN